MTIITSPSAFTNPDYHDYFTLTAAQPFTSIDDFIERLALSQPAWLIRLSTGLKNRAAVEHAVESMRNGTEPAIGNWKVIERTDNSVTLAEDMRIMRYRLTYTFVGPNAVTAETEVVQQSRWFGPTYWALTIPMHKRFLQMMLRNAGGAESTTVETKIM